MKSALVVVTIMSIELVVVIVVVPRMWRGRKDDVGSHPHLDTSAAACCRRDHCPTYQWPFVVFQDGEREVSCGPADG